MICQLELDVSGKKENFAKDFFNSISFVKNVKILKEKEITNPKILTRIENYEKNKTKLIPVSSNKMKENMLNA